MTSFTSAGIECSFPVVALYSYDAQGDDELSLIAGERVELSAGERGGESYGEGWWEGFNSHGQLGIFPSNYVRHDVCLSVFVLTLRRCNTFKFGPGIHKLSL